MQKIRVAAVSPRFPGGDDKQGNLDAAWRGIEAAKAAGAELAVFSELSLTQCLDERSYRAAEPVPEGPAAQQIVRFARESGVTVAAGIEELDPKTGVVYNTHFLAGPQGYVGKHRKTHLMVSEWRAHRPGCDFEVFDIGKCVVGIAICHENMYPEISRIQSLKGMEVSIRN